MSNAKADSTKPGSNGTPTPAPPPSKPKQERSPNYPRFDLKTAIARAKQIYDQEKKQSAPAIVAMKHLGFGSASGPARSTLSALVKYGLLDEEGRGEDRHVKLSRLGLNILLDEQPISPERDEAIKQAALKPKILAHLWAKYGNELPSEATFRTYLMRDMDFTDSAAGELINIYKDTIEFAKLGAQDTIAEGDVEEDDSDPPEGEGAMPQETKSNPAGAKPTPKGPSGFFQSPTAPPSGSRDLPITLPSLELAVLRVPVPMSAEDFDALMTTLNAMKKRLVASEGGQGGANQGQG